MPARAIILVHFMKNAKFLIAVFYLMIFAMVYEANAAVPAFPEAEGGGAESVGGRGGQIIYVTNLNSEGPGSLREAMEETLGPRIVVFNVSGIIHLQKTATNPNGFVYVTNPYLTVAGQTAPGGGITVHGQIYIQAHDVVLRYLTVRGGDATNNNYLYGTGINIGGNAKSNVIIDHVSVSWAHDDTMQIWTTKKISGFTFSWNLIGEGLRDPKQNTSQGMIFGSNTAEGIYTNNVDVHHNVMMKFMARLPRAAIQDIRITNNLIYYAGWGIVTALHGGIKADVVGNVYKRIPDDAYEVRGYGNPDGNINYGLNGNPSIYIVKNKGPHQLNPDGDNWPMVREGSTNPSWRRTTPILSPKYPVTVHPANTLEDLVLNDVGNSRRLDENGNWIKRRDSVDARLINEYRTNTGIIPWQKSSSTPWDASEVGGWPVIASGTPYTDTDRDGMPNAWETNNGLNPNNAADANQDADNDGYTNIEEFLNGNASIITNPTPTCTDGIKNQGETGIDCGGPCPACSSLPNQLILKPGWNQISSPVAAGISLAAIESSCTVLPYKNQKLWAWNATAQVWMNPSKVEPLKGYWIYAAYQCTVPLSGTSATFTSLPLSVGWNKISASGTFSTIQGTCASHITGNWVWHWDKATEKWIHPATMQLDKGYWIKVNQNCVLGS